MLKIKIYSGLSLDEKIIHKYLPNAIVSRPIKRSDIYNDIKDGIHIIGIIDGEFLQNLSVTPTEICDAMRCGISIYGSSSMGAMRAAELSEFGMIGYGKIFEQIIADPYFRDDKLGQIFYDEINFRSTPYMDLHFGISELVDRGLLVSKDAKDILKIYEKIHFSERNFKALASKLSGGINKQTRLLGAIKIAQKYLSSQKSKDGIGLMKLIANDILLTKIKLQKLL